MFGHKDMFIHALEHGNIGQRVHLTDRCVGPGIDIGDNPDNRDTVQQGLSHARHGIRDPWAWNDAVNAWTTRDASSSIGHHAA